MALLRDNKNLVAMGLLLATIVSWFTFEEFHGYVIASVVIILISTVKVKAVMSSFMEIEAMPGPWKYMMNGWLAVVCLSMLIAELM
ncbi:cytochrome C oxidase subunit IV family protein [Zhongshania guokunii]|uniref:Cytochrome C oxidase subunit IV family protein n=1 Tax=Zhongshania guokunii TaxID=641783 RepID=A0ABV3U0E9_9GAMM